MEYIIGFLIILVIIAGLIIRNLLKQTEQLDDLIRQTKIDTIQKVQLTLDEMKRIDNRGAFEKDDEVGSAFTDMISIINDLHQQI